MDDAPKVLLEEEVIKLDLKKIFVPPEVSLQNLPDLRLTLYEIVTDYCEINIQGNSLIEDLCIKVPGTEKARTMFFRLLNNMRRGEYITKTEFKIKIIPDYYKQHFSGS